MSTTNSSTRTSRYVQDSFITKTVTKTILPGTFTDSVYETTIVTLDDTISPTTYTTRTWKLTTSTRNGTTSIYTTTISPTPTATSTQSTIPGPGTGNGNESINGAALGDFTLGEKIGMGLGAGAGALAVLALIWCMVKKRRRGAVRLPTSNIQQLLEKQNSQPHTKNHNSSINVRQSPSEVWT